MDSPRAVQQLSTLTMKFLVVLALSTLAMAEPEANADAQQFIYNGYNGYYGNYGYNLLPYAYHPYSTYHYGKRDAEAEAEPQLINPTIYSGVLPSVHYPVVQKTVVAKKEGEVAPLIYNTLPVQTPLVYNTAVKTPLVYNTAVKTPVVYNTALRTQPLLNAFSTLKTFTTPVVSKSVISKREAEADPAVLYTNQHPLVYNTLPLLNTGLNTHLVPTAVKTPLLKTLDNAVVPTVGGYIHSSHAGICTNNIGVRVPC